MKPRRKQEPNSFIVTVECTITKVVVVEGCTEQQAKDDPFAYSIEETDTGMSNWSVQSIEPNC